MKRKRLGRISLVVLLLTLIYAPVLARRVREEEFQMLALPKAKNVIYKENMDMTTINRDPRDFVIIFYRPSDVQVTRRLTYFLKHHPNLKVKCTIYINVMTKKNQVLDKELGLQDNLMTIGYFADGKMQNRILIDQETDLESHFEKMINGISYY